MSDFEGARLALAQVEFRLSDELGRALERSVEISAKALHVERAGVWLLSAEHHTLNCVVCYELSSATLSSGEAVDLSAAPAYARALRSRRVVAAPDALLDARTCELGASYLLPHRIRAMIDAPIFRGGELIGVVCLEHVGGIREWSKRDADFAVSVAEMVSTMIEQASRLDAEEKRRASEERSALATRMESLGRLAAGVAHDFNSVLQAVSLTAQLSVRDAELRERRGEVGSAQPHRDRMQEIATHVERGARLVKHLLAFAKAEPDVGGITDAAQLLAEMRPLFTSLLSGAWQVDCTASLEPIRVALDRTQLEQIILNLVANARDAMPSGGKVLLTLGVTPERTHAVLCVADEGSGIDETILDRVFEPFFTTKQPDSGTGLGLSIVYGIVQRAHGEVEVETTSGHGTRFRILLPLLEGEPDNVYSTPTW